jgi:uncharacterized protein
MIFELWADKEGDRKIFFYDNEKNILTTETGEVFEYPDAKPQEGLTPYIPFNKDLPLKKSRSLKTVKIQLGLSCNYTCDYCSQKFVERPKETNPKDIEDFMTMFNNLEFDPKIGLRVELWGGEPLVYWKTLKPLAEAIADKFSDWPTPPQFSMITNGSLLTEEICAWLYSMGFSVSISHDGPGQAVRGPDPFDDPVKKETILNFYEIMKPHNRISFNAMMNSKNTSRKAIYDWFVELTGDPYVPLGEGAFVDAYDEDGLESSLNTKKEHFDYRLQSFADIFMTHGQIGFQGILQKIDDFTETVLSHKEATYLGQKCGMDDEHTVAFDLRGNVVTCQNVSALEIGKNGESHLGGSITDIENVEIKTATHWSNRLECPKCPVLHICKGACMFLDGEYWTKSCDNAFSDAIPLFVLSLEKITEGYKVYYINNSELPPERKDIFGWNLKHEDDPKKKIIPIKVVAEKVAVIDNVEVYGKSTVVA